MNTPNTFGGKAVLTLAHVAGMIDMVALPLWIGTLMQYYRYSPQQAGLTVTVFLLGVVLSSVSLAPRFNHLPRRVAATSGFALAAMAFFFASQQAVDVANFQVMAMLHLLGGLGVGCALTFTHGSMGRSANPHRAFAVGNVALGVFAVGFMATVPNVLQHAGAAMFFTVIATTMGIATVLMAVAFPTINEPDTAAAPSTPVLSKPIPAAAWFVISVVVCLTLNQAMVFSFLERIGADRGFGADRVNGVLIALGLVNLTPGILAALLQKKMVACCSRHGWAGGSGCAGAHDVQRTHVCALCGSGQPVCLHGDLYAQLFVRPADAA